MGAKKSIICGLHFEANCFKGAKKGRLDFNKAVISDLFNNNNPGFPFTAASASIATPGPAPEASPGPASGPPRAALGPAPGSAPRAAPGPAPGSAPGSTPGAALGPAPGYPNISIFFLY